MLLGVNFLVFSRNWGIFLANIFSSIFIICDIRATGRQFLGSFLEPPLYIDAVMARLRSIDISPVFSEALYSSWRGWAWFLWHCLRSNAGNSLEPTDEICESFH